MNIIEAGFWYYFQKEGDESDELETCIEHLNPTQISAFI